jgi:hypothetical protein
MTAAFPCLFSQMFLNCTWNGRNEQTLTLGYETGYIGCIKLDNLALGSKKLSLLRLRKCKMFSVYFVKQKICAFGSEINIIISIIKAHCFMSMQDMSCSHYKSHKIAFVMMIRNFLSSSKRDSIFFSFLPYVDQRDQLKIVKFHGFQITVHQNVIWFTFEL